MNRRNIFSLSAIAGLGLASTAMLGMLSGAAHAQTAKDLVGAWILASTDNTNAQGAKVEPFGPHPLGSYMFDAGGHYAQVIVGSEPSTGQGANQATIATYGTYSIADGGKTLALHVVGSNSQDLDGKDIKRQITSLTGDELKISNSSPQTAVGSAHAVSVWKRTK